MDDKQIFQKGMVVEIKRNLLGIKKPNKKKKLIRLASCYTKFMEDGSSKDGVESIYNIHLHTT